MGSNGAVKRSLNGGLFDVNASISDVHGATPDADVIAAIENFDSRLIEPGFKRCLKGEHRSSILYDWGIRAERIQGTSDSSYQALFYCLGSEECRQAGTVVRMKRVDNTCQATNHLRSSHGAMARKRTRESSSVKRQKYGVVTYNKTFVPKLKLDNSFRFRCLHSVFAFIISKFQPFDFFENPVICRFYLKEMPTLATGPLYHGAVLKMIVELYQYSTDCIRRRIDLLKGSFPLFHLSVGTWSNAASVEDYIGIRIWWVDEKWSLQSEILAIRHFCPNTTEMISLSDQIYRWTEQVLDEFGLTYEDIFSSNLYEFLLSQTCYGCLSTNKWKHDIYIPNFLSKVLYDKVIDMENQGPTLVEQMKSVTQELSLMGFSDCHSKIGSTFNSTLYHYMVGQLYQQDPVHWTELVTFVGYFISGWENIVTCYKASGTPFPLEDRLNEIKELYSIVKPITLIMEACQSLHSHTASTGLLMLIKLRSTVLRCDSSLDILNPRSESSAAVKMHGELHPRTQMIRATIAESIDQNFFSRRYSADFPGSYVYDIASFLNPLFNSLPYIKKLASLPDTFLENSESIQSSLLEEVTRLVEKVIITDQNDERTNTHHAVVDDKNECLEENTDSSLDQKLTIDMEMLALFGIDVIDCQPISSTVKLAPTSIIGPHATAKQTIEAYQSLELGSWREKLVKGQGQWNGNIVLEWWKDVGSKLPELQPLVKLARSVLGTQATDGIVEQQFSTPTRFMSGGRQYLFPYDEMVLFLHTTNLNPDAFDEIQQISSEDIVDYIPKRWKEDNLMSDLGTMNFDQKLRRGESNWQAYTEVLLNTVYPKQSISI